MKIVSDFFNKVCKEIGKTYFPNVKYYRDNTHTTAIHRDVELFNNGCLEYDILIARISDSTGDTKENIDKIVSKYIEDAEGFKANVKPGFKYQFGGITIQGHNINELKEFAEELGQLAKDAGADISKHLNDACFAIDTDYQAYHDLDPDNWDIVHK